MSTTCTPNSNDSNSSTSPAILNQSDPNDISFGSAFSSVPINNLNSVSELCGRSINSGSSLKKKFYPCITIILRGGCLGLLIYL